MPIEATVAVRTIVSICENDMSMPLIENRAIKKSLQYMISPAQAKNTFALDDFPMLCLIGNFAKREILQLYENDR